jgi:hypothetical protein
MSAMAMEVTAGGKTLADLMGASEKALAAGLSAPVLREAAQSAAGREAAWGAMLARPGLAGKVAGSLCGVLQEDMVGLFAGAWAKYYELRKCAKETLSHAGQPATVVLAEHDFTYAFEPSVVVTVNGVQVAEIPFQVALTVSVEGLELELCDGFVRRVTAGTCAGKGTIRCKDAVVWERALGSRDLPGDLVLKKPLRLA